MVITAKKYKCGFLNVLESFKMEYSTFGVKNGIEVLLIELENLRFRKATDSKWYRNCVKGTFITNIVLFGIASNTSKDKNYFLELDAFFVESKYEGTIPLELVTDSICDVLPEYIKNNTLETNRYI